MRTNVFVVFLLSLVATAAADIKEPLASPPAEIDSREAYNRDGRANFAAACISVIRETDRKRLTIYATVPPVRLGQQLNPKIILPPKAKRLKEGSYEIEVLYHEDLATNNAPYSGAYHRNHNAMILNFAAAQFAAEQKSLGIRLVQLLAEADPTMWWSMPSPPWQPAKRQRMTIKEILEGLEKNDPGMSEFLEHESFNWSLRVKKYRM